MHRLLLVFLPVIFSLLPAAATAQSRFKMPGEKPLPTTVRRDPKTKQLTNKVWLAVEGYRPRYEYDPSAPEVLGKFSTFMQAFFVVAEHQDEKTGRDYLLLAKADNGIVEEMFGWVDYKLVVWATEPMTDSEDGWYRKLRVVNTPHSIQKGVGSAKAASSFTEVTVTLAPKAGTPGKGGFRVASLFFVYAEVEGYVLIGSAPYFDPKAPAKVVKGWIPSDRISRWGTRLAVEWNVENTREGANPRRREPGFMISSLSKDGRLNEPESRDAAQKYLHDALTRDELDKQKLIAFPEIFDSKGVSTPWSPKRPRHPILEKPKRPDPLTQNSLLKVGWLGGEVDGNSTEVIDRKLKEAEERARQLDVLVVIDHTVSMEKYFPVVSQAVANLFLDVQKQTKTRDVRVAVAYYGDVHESKIPFQINPFVSLGLQEAALAAKTADYIEHYLRFMGNVAVKQKPPGEADFFGENPPPFTPLPPVLQLIREVHNHRNQGGGGGARESVFEGIRRAISESRFRPNVQTLVVVIGDMGDLSGEGDANEGKDRVFNERDRVVEDLFPSDGLPRELLVIHTEAPKPGGGRRHPDAELFDIQLRSIVDRANARLAREHPPEKGQPAELPASFTSSSELDRIRGLLEERYQALKRRSMMIEEAIKEMRQGDWDQWRKALGSAVVRGLEAQLEASNLDIDKLRNAQGAEVYIEGVIWQYESGTRRVPVIRKRVLLNNKEIKNIVDLLERLVGERIRGLRRGSLVQLVRAEIEAAAGDSGSIKTLQETLDIRGKLPFTSRLLQASVGDLADMVDDEKERNELRLKLALLKDLLDGVEHDWQIKSKKIDDSGSMESVLTFTQERKFPRDFDIPEDPDETKWYWVDLELEMP